MEQLVLEKLQLLLHGDGPSDLHTLLQTLASCRALISNPACSESAARSVFDALAHFLGHEHRPSLLRHAIKLLGDVTALHRALLPSAVAAVRPLLSCGKRPLAEALSILLSVVEGGGEGMSVVRSVLDVHLVLSLASSRAVVVRSLLLKLLVLDIDHGGASSFALEQPLLVLRVLVGLTADLYPSVRSAALDGLLAFFTNVVAEFEVSVMQKCYDVAVALLHDVDTSVRISGIRLASKLVGMLVATKEGRDSSGCSDALFLLLCSFARDMDMKVRVEVFVALGKIKMVSEYILLQSLSKKIMRSNNRGKLLAKCNLAESRPSLSCAAGVFVHGLEDEFNEVRRAACDSLGILTFLSSTFADNALNLFMDMLNDDSAVVQLQTLEALSQMIMHDNLNVQERHMHMFLGALANNSASIRCAARKVIQLMKFPEMEIFRSSISELLVNLEAYPEDEEDILKVLFCIGKSHGGFAAIMKEFAQEIEDTCLGELNLDSPRAVALLVLALSPTFSNENLSYDVPAKNVFYSISLFGRISHSLRGLMGEDALLAHLCRLSGLPYLGTKSESEEAKMEENETTLHEKLAISVSKQILRAATEIWPMIKAHRTHEVLKILRACKEELEMVALGLNETSKTCLVFTLEYVQLIQLIAEVLEQMQPKHSHALKMRNLDILLEKLEISLRTLRYCFPGLSKEEESRVLELTLFACVLRLSNVGILVDPIMRKMQSVITHLELIHGETSDLSDFVKVFKNFCSQGGMNDASGHTHSSDIFKCFSLEPMVFCGKFRHTKAELQVLSEDSELLLPFVQGLPVGITFNIILYNVSKDDRVWIRMEVGESIQYAFMDLTQFDSSDFERRCIVDVPFYGTPKAAFFLLKVRVCLECPCELVTQNRKGQAGPRCKIVFLCEEKDVYLADVDKIKMKDRD